MMKNILFSACAAGIFALLPVLPASAVVLVDETFSDGVLSGGSDPLDANWSVASGGSLILSIAAPFNPTGNTSNALIFNSTRTGNTGPFPQAQASYSSAALAIGQSIVLSLDFRLTSTIPNVSGALRFGLGSSANTYVFGFGMGSAPSASWREYAANLTSGTGTALTTSFTDVSIADMTPHVLSLTLTRTAANSLSLTAGIDGATNAVGTKTGISNFNFDRIEIGQGDVNNVDLNIDNVLVQTVPEPGSIVLFGLGVGVVLLRRRRESAAIR